MKTNISEAINKISSFITSNKNIFVAYSGGLDSTVLLHLLFTLRRAQPKIRLTAIHINHNLSPSAKKWVRHCQKICNNLGIECVIKNVNAKIRIKGYSPEELARKLRYEVFADCLPKGVLLLTAHQANDQAETLLLQLFRGAGPKGLAAMPTKVKFAKGWLVRPLLNFSRIELLQYAKEHNLTWIEDESNADIKFDRNLIRHKLMPVIKKNWPGVVTTLSRAANHCAEASELLANLATEDLAKVVGETQDTIDIEALKELVDIRQHNVLRFWLHILHLPTPSEVKLNEVERTIINSRIDANPVVRWHGAEIRRFQNHLYAMPPLLVFDNKIILRWYLKKPLKLPGNLGILQAEANKKFKTNVKSEIFTVRFRQGAEKLKLPKRQGTHKLKKLMQEWRVPPWLRDRIPLVYYGEKIIAVVGYCSVDGVQIKLKPR